jgi:hypothetical protein
MSAASHYQINVSQSGSHYFSTSAEHGHFLSEYEAEKMVRDFRERFPESEGFEVTCTYWECRGHRKEW